MKRAHILYVLAAISALVAVAVSADTYTGKPDPYNKTVTITIPTGTYAAKSSPYMLGNLGVDGGVVARQFGLNTTFSDAGTTTTFKGVQTLTSGSVDVASVASKGTGTQTFTLNGVAVGDIVQLVSAGTAIPAGLVFACFVSAANTVTCELSNNTGLAVDPAAQTYTFVVFDVT